MPDQKPPRLAGDERAVVCTLLQFQRESLVRKVTGVDDADARRSPVASGTSLVWLVKHLARAERLWVLHRFAGGDAGSQDDTVAPDDTVESAVADYRDTWARVDGVVASSSLDDLGARAPVGPPTDLRWVLGHLLEETARHAGHADILRELLDGDVGR